ncbi:MAG TPA: hypothetical protein VGJ00_04060 [Rhabdochlamydiaceae bacterium]|jgi:hypothetical protein
MSKLILNNVVSQGTLVTAASTLNNNSSSTVTAIENTLSRDGTSPNYMNSELDMNSNEIINLGSPSTANSAVRLSDLNNTIFGPSGPVLYAAVFSGDTAGDKIAAAIAALPSTGGIVDARGLSSGGVIPGFTISKNNVQILGPVGSFNVTGTINIYNPTGISSVSWLGCGSSSTGKGTNFTWRGDTTSPMFRIRGCRDSSFKDFIINSSINFPLAEGIRLETATGTTSTNRHFQNITMNGTNSASAGLTKGFRWCIGDDTSDGAGGDVNNDLDGIYDCIVENFFNAAYSIEHSQSKTHTFINSTFLSGKRGVSTTQATNSANNSGSFRWYGGGGGSCSIADFDIGNPDDVVSIIGSNTEGSSRLLLTGGPSSGLEPINIIGCRWAANNINADDRVIWFKFRGNINLLGNIFQSPAAGHSPAFFISNGGLASRSTAIGNIITWNSATASSNPFLGDGPCWETVGNMIVDNSNNQFVLPTLFPNNVVTNSIRGTAVTFANRPSTAVEGMLVSFTDSTTAIWGATIAGTGSNHVLGYYNGTNWTVAAS